MAPRPQALLKYCTKLEHCTSKRLITCLGHMHKRTTYQECSRQFIVAHTKLASLTVSTFCACMQKHVLLVEVFLKRSTAICAECKQTDWFRRLVVLSNLQSVRFVIWQEHAEDQHSKTKGNIVVLEAGDWTLGTHLESHAVFSKACKIHSTEQWANIISRVKYTRTRVQHHAATIAGTLTQHQNLLQVGNTM